MKILISSLIDIQKSAHNTRLHQFLKYLINKHEITVLSVNDWWKAKWDKRTSCYYRGFDDLYEQINTIYLTKKKISPVLQDVLSSITVKNILDKIIIKKFDVHFNYNGLFSGCAMAKHASFNSISTVYDIADDLPEMIRTSPQIPSIIRPIGGNIGKNIVQKNIRISKKITLTTNLLGELYNIHPSKTVEIPNGVDIELFRPYTVDQLKEKLEISNSFVVGYVGVLREWIDLEPLFIAIKQLMSKIDLKLLIVGGGIGYNKTVKLANQYNLKNNIVFVGTIPYPLVPKYISCMDVCVIPFKENKVSLYSLPLKLFEYMACEKPVISTYITEIRKKFKNKVLFVSEVEHYKKHIIDLYQNSDVRKKMGYDGRQIVKDHYQWSKNTLKLEKILQELG